MTRARSVFLAACCGALALPTFAWADPPSTGGGPATATTTGGTDSSATCDYDRVCAERARAQAAARAQARARHRRTVAHRASRPEPQPATMHIDTRITRRVADNCQYTAKARGTYRSTALTSDAPNGSVRDVHMVAGTVLTCGDQVVRRQSHRWVLPSSTRAELTQTMHDRLALQVPSSSCTYSSNYSFQGGNLLAQGVDGSCSRRDEVTALSGFGAQDSNMARGGGPMQTPERDDNKPLEPTSRDARPGAR